MTAEQTAELRAHLGNMTKERLITELVNAQDWADNLHSENMHMYGKVSELTRNGGTAGRVAQRELERDQYKARYERVQHELDALAAANKELATRLDNARQLKFDAPIRCACGCQQLVQQPATGRARHYVNATHRKRAERRRKLQAKCHERA